MGQHLYSESLPAFTGEINNPSLSGSIDDLKRFLGNKKLSLFQWSENQLAIAVTASVELPPLGCFQDLDIKTKEPVLIVAHLANYPAIAPVVFPDRLNFPKNNLAHLYIARKGRPPALCLVRGDLEEWYSNKKLKDLYLRVENWLRDAATGELSEDGDQFDPLRLEGYTGTMIYDYDQVARIVNEKASYFEHSDFAVGLFERNISDDRVVFKLTKIVTQQNIDESIDELKKEKEKADSIPSKKNYHFGYLVWPETANAFGQYCVSLPDDWNGLKEFCAKHEVITDKLEKQIACNDKNVFVSIPLIIAIRRPKKIIGFSEDIEFINFAAKVDTGDVAGEKIVNNVPVSFYKHGQPLSRSKAKQISGAQFDLGNYAFVAGCGALGSKIVIHFARSGATNLLLTDPDDLSPHNLVRHTLFGNSEGLNKADALKREITSIYPYEKLSLLRSAKTSGEVFLDPELTKFFSWIFDFTASNAFAQSLIKADIKTDARIVRSFITDFGSIGITFFEGKGRNPRIDDLQIMLYAQFDKMAFISSWLQRERNDSSKKNNLTLTIGVGCNSETTVLSDDIVSMHSAYASAVIKEESKHGQDKEGKVYINEIKYAPFFSSSTNLIAMPPLDIFSAINDRSWQIRMKAGIIEEMKREMGLAMPSETGGVFIGCANYKTKTIHVSGMLKAPADSEANPVCFFRGVEGLPEAINQINQSTGNQLGYIGEWHTHPFGPNELSMTDTNSIKKFKKEFDNLQTPLPVFLMIITPTHLLPYVY